MRQIVLDTETTGLEPSQGHRIIEIGCVEMVNRRLTGRHYHQYIQPEREVEPQAIEVHGITNEFLADEPVFSAIADEFMAFVDGAELVIHNAPFDVGFIDHELTLLGRHYTVITDYCQVVDSLVLARKKHPGQKNNLDALCKRYFVDNSQRDLHGALLDAEILADVYLLMTGGQTSLSLSDSETAPQSSSVVSQQQVRRLSQPVSTPIIYATDNELALHQAKLEGIAKKASDGCLWMIESVS